MVSIKKQVLLLIIITLSVSFVSATFSGDGTGTFEDPYNITNCTQLQEINDARAANYSLGNNINCSDTINWNSGNGFVPIGNSTAGYKFTGNFEGQNYTITNLFINKSSTAYIGLFGYSLGNISNVGLVNANITGLSDVGGIAGYLKAKIEHSYVTGNIVANDNSGDSRTGGLVGYFDSTSIILNSYSTADVTATGWAVGGLVGYSEGTINNSYVTGNVNGYSSVGGLVAFNYGPISNSYARGNVEGTKSSTSYVGGLVGENYKAISNSYSTGNVTSAGNTVGGFIGENAANPFSVSNSYSTGTVSGVGIFIGGFIGRLSSGTIINSYWYNQSQGLNCTNTDNSNCIAVSTLEYFYNYDNPPMNLTLGGGWDFETIWDDVYNGTDYPVLQWQNADVSDTDNDGIGDSSDKLYYNESNVNTTGVTDLNISVGGNSTSGSYYDGTYDINFYGGSDLLVNFTHNFTTTTLDLSKVTITKTSNSLIINLSGQLQGNKTVYIADNSFVSLCVKDAEVASIDAISSTCTGDNETDMTSCIGESYSDNGIDCVDEGTTIKISNLRHSAILGVPATTSTPNTGGGGSCTSVWSCTEWSKCVEGTQNRTCTDTRCHRTYGKPAETQNCTCSENWICGSWSECSTDGKQTRTCSDYNNCGTTKLKPKIQQSCIYKINDTKTFDITNSQSQNNDIDAKLQKENNQETVKDMKNTNRYWIIAVILIIISAIVFFFYKKKEHKKK